MMKAFKNWSWLLSVIILLIVPILFRDNNYYLHIFVLVAINIILTASLRAIASVGQISMGAMAFAGVGAYTSAILMKKMALPFLVAFPLSGIASMIVAAVVAYPFVRVTGIYFTMLTLFLGEVIRLIITQWTSMTGGSAGMLKIPSIGTFSMGGANINFIHLLPYSYLVFAIMVLILLFLYRIDRSQIGTTLEAIEKDEKVAESVGINVIRFKVLIFCIGSFFTGLAGSLYAHHLRVLNPNSFGLFPSIYIMIYMVVGGRKKFSGSIIGAVVLTLIPELFRPLKEYQPYVFAAVLFLVLFLLRQGLSDLVEQVKIRITGVKERRAEHA
jgi:branched-chain amino acid transport system permease protein